MGKDPPMRLIMLGILQLAVNGLMGQEGIISGIVVNSMRQPIQGVTITVRSVDSTKILGYAITGKGGSFRIKDLPPRLEQLVLEFRHISFESRSLSVKGLQQHWPESLDIELKEKALELREIVIKREIPVLIRSDTVVFNANSHRGPEVRKVEDLLKKIQGFSVDPNGRLSFNGKPVEKVLIDGDDLADQAYQMITKNLDAVTVDKVEVINNFSENRLLRNIVETNKVGVNLKISSRYKSRVSGGIEVGAAIERRNNADLNIIYPGKRSKWLIFGNYNNVARDPSGNARYYYQQEGGQVNQFEYGAGGSMVLEHGNFSIPSIGERYTTDNRDFGFSVMNSWKIGEYVRINCLLGYDDLGAEKNSFSSVFTDISDQERWFVNNEMRVNNRGKDLVARFSIQRDGGKKHVSRIDLVLNGGRHSHRFSNVTTGSITDSLLEKLNNRLKEIRLGWQETFLLGSRVLQLHFNVETGGYDQELNISSSRYLSYWALDSTYIENKQALENRKEQYDVAIRINGKSGQFQYEYGVKSEYRVLVKRTEALISSTDAKPDFSSGFRSFDTRDLILKGVFRVGLRPGKKGWLGINGELGWEQLETVSDNRGFMTFNAGLGYTKSFSLLNSIRVNYKLGRGFKEYNRFYPDELISGNGMILNGLDFSGPEFSHGFLAAWNSNNISKQRNWSANFSYIMMPQRYTNGVVAYPEYSQQFFELSHNNSLLNAGLNWETYIRKLRGRLGALVSFNSGRYESSVNQVKGSSIRSGIRMESWWVSGFLMPLNAELRGAINYSAGRWAQGELNRNWQYYWSFKLKLKTAGSFYGALVWNYHKLSAQQVFHGMDLFSSIKLSSMVVLTLNGSNLLNVGRVIERTVLPYSRSGSSYQLVGRYLLFSLNLHF
jgi:hypothetical protein